MNSIFLRIYGGMLLALLVIGALAYSAVQLVNDYRSEIYREQMARGTFYLMAQSIDRQENEAAREQWLQVLSRLIGAEVMVRQRSQFEFTYSEQQAFRNEHVVMRVNDEEGYADIFYPIDLQTGELVYSRMTKVGEAQARATALFVLDALAQHPQSEWDAVFERIQARFGFPLSREPLSALSLDAEQRQRLERREVVLQLGEGGRKQSHIRVLAPIGTTGDVLVMGPLFLFDWLPLEMSIIVGVLGLSAMGLAAYLLVRPLQTRLRQLDRSVAQISAGNLDVQVEVGAPDAIGQLAETFNGMTAHIKRLIDSQREMTRAVSHELRTPVARLRFGLEMLADCDAPEQRRKKLDELDHDIDQLDALIDEILTFARLEEGSPALKFEAVDVPALLHSLQSELTPIAGKIAIQIDQASIDRVAPEYRMAEGEARYLHRVLQNLITNALRYAGSTIRIRYQANAETASVWVEDDGPGIPEAQRENVFKPFARLDSSRHRDSGGYGLGLSIVKRIVDWHGGSVTISDSPLGGAAFCVSWPRVAQGGHVLADKPA